MACVEVRAQLAALIERQVGNDEARNARAHRRFGEALETERQQGIQIAHQQQRRIDAGAGTQILHLLENPAQAHTLRQRRLAGALDGHPVRHGIGEGNSDLHHVRPRGHAEQVLTKSLPTRIAGRQESDQGRLPLGGGFANGRRDALGGSHFRTASSVVCRVGMSLSPRPERHTRMRPPGCLAAQARAPASA